MAEEEKEIKKQWDELINSLDLPKINFSFEITCGNRLEEILKKVSEEKIDLIVMGRRGKILQTGLGSVSKAVIKNAKIPVLLVN